jgi:hypothetical protein
VGIVAAVLNARYGVLTTGSTGLDLLIGGGSAFVVTSIVALGGHTLNEASGRYRTERKRAETAEGRLLPRLAFLEQEIDRNFTMEPAPSHNYVMTLAVIVVNEGGSSVDDVGLSVIQIDGRSTNHFIKRNEDERWRFSLAPSERAILPIAHIVMDKDGNAGEFKLGGTFRDDTITVGRPPDDKVTVTYQLVGKDTPAVERRYEIGYDRNERRLTVRRLETSAS